MNITYSDINRYSQRHAEDYQTLVLLNRAFELAAEVQQVKEPLTKVEPGRLIVALAHQIVHEIHWAQIIVCLSLQMCFILTKLLTAESINHKKHFALSIFKDGHLEQAANQSGYIHALHQDLQFFDPTSSHSINVTMCRQRHIDLVMRNFISTLANNSGTPFSFEKAQIPVGKYPDNAQALSQNLFHLLRAFSRASHATLKRLELTLDYVNILEISEAPKKKKILENAQKILANMPVMIESGKVYHSELNGLIHHSP